MMTKYVIYYGSRICMVENVERTSGSTIRPDVVSWLFTADGKQVSAGDACFDSFEEARKFLLVGLQAKVEQAQRKMTVQVECLAGELISARASLKKAQNMSQDDLNGV